MRFSIFIRSDPRNARIATATPAAIPSGPVSAATGRAKPAIAIPPRVMPAVDPTAPPKKPASTEDLIRSIWPAHFKIRPGSSGSSFSRSFDALRSSAILFSDSGFKAGRFVLVMRDGDGSLAIGQSSFELDTKSRCDRECALNVERGAHHHAGGDHDPVA